jgi:valyl-tRNA synthetase
MNIPMQSRLKLYLGTTDQVARDVVNESAGQIKRLARVDEIVISDILPELDSVARGIARGIDIAIPLGGLIDFDKERERVTKEMARKEVEARGLAGRLDNISFVERAPAEVVQEARNRHQELIAEIEKLRDTLQSLVEK